MMGMQPKISSWSSTRHPGDWGAYCTSTANCRDGSQTLHKLDVKRFKIEVGKAKDQALLEPLATLVGVRLWARICYTRKWAVYLRSDSQAALGATLKLRSPDPRINAVVREISLDLTEGKLEIDFFEHIPGANNVYADSLSRFYQPGALRKIPEELQAQSEMCRRREAKSGGRRPRESGDQEDSEGAAEQSTEEGGQRRRSVIACMPWETKRKVRDTTSANPATSSDFQIT